MHHSDNRPLCSHCHFLLSVSSLRFSLSFSISTISSCCCALVIQRFYLSFLDSWLKTLSLGSHMHVIFSHIMTSKIRALSLISLWRSRLGVPHCLFIWWESVSTLQQRGFHLRAWWVWHNNYLTIPQLLLWNTVQQI